ncbi:relaxase/mobilization nuclease domain-containing protein [Paludibacterium sp.]|uniref:relaxase/mobilization nuclease domain-containing protein n=1 Tax=Paludibacterium sp. TaxID=1917523 RepID=UPI0025ED99A8|nr:relaxase/mobilization nuclease domain-containing protein [Paludibacterium sp.]
MGRYLLGAGEYREENEFTEFLYSENCQGRRDMRAIMAHMFEIAYPKMTQKIRPLQKPIEHFSIRTREGDKLTPEQALETARRVIQEAGYETCPWVMAAHIKDGHKHYHVAVCRVDYNGQLFDPLMRPICKRIADEQAARYGFNPADGGTKNNKRFTASHKRVFDLWRACELMTPEQRLKTFIENRYLPARGDRGQLVFVDMNGKAIALWRNPKLKAEGYSAGVFPALFGFTPEKLAALPTVKEVQEQQLIITKQKRKAGAYDFYTRSRHRNGGNLRHDPLRKLRPWLGAKVKRQDIHSLSGRRWGSLARDGLLQHVRNKANLGQTAYDAAMLGLAEQIEAIEKDSSLSPMEKRLRVASLIRWKKRQAQIARFRAIEADNLEAEKQRNDERRQIQESRLTRS